MFGRDIALVQIQFVPPLLGRVLVEPDWVTIMVPMALRTEFIFNGVSARPNDIFVSSSRNGYVSSGANRDNIVLHVRRSKLVTTVRALTGGVSEDLVLTDARLRLGDIHGTRFRRLIQQVMLAASAAQGGSDHFVLDECLENDLLNEIANVLGVQAYSGPLRDPGRIDAVRVVRAASEAIKAHPLQIATIANLCEASGVGQTWLYKCFDEVCGTSPNAYIRARRLCIARERLLDPLAPPRSVKDVALSLGFMNGGRFAADYQRLFGERPSDTFLARVKP